jgi:hypothetical protein
MSILKNIFRTRKPPGTRYTLSIICPNGSAAYNLQISMPELVESMLHKDQGPQRVEIWKHCEQQSDTGIGSMVHWQSFPLWFSPPNLNRGTDG